MRNGASRLVTARDENGNAGQLSAPLRMAAIGPTRACAMTLKEAP